MSVNGEYSQRTSQAFNKTEYSSSTKISRGAKWVSVALGAIAIAGTLATFLGHGGISTMGSNFMLFGGVAATASLCVSIPLAVRDFQDKKRMSGELSIQTLRNGYKGEFEAMKPGDSSSHTTKINGRPVTVTLEKAEKKGGDKIKVEKK